MTQEEGFFKGIKSMAEQPVPEELLTEDILTDELHHWINTNGCRPNILTMNSKSYYDLLSLNMIIRDGEERYYYDVQIAIDMKLEHQQFNIY